LFRRFSQIDAGVTGGPGSALGWAWMGFVASFAGSPTTARALRALGRSTGFWWKYFDVLLNRRPGACDVASGLFFLGCKADKTLGERAIVRAYRGLVPTPRPR
jgi:hypothetical protein